MSRRYRVVAVVLTACICAMSATWAYAQGGGRRGGGGMGMMASPVMLIRAPAVQTELKLTDDQKTKITEALPAPGGARGAMDPAARAEAEKKIEGILTADQNARLKQIVLQAQGAAALNNPDVVAALAITDDQKTKLQDVQQQSREKMKTAMPDLANATPQERQAKMQELMKESLTAALAVLTADQKAKFEKMLGPKFDTSGLMRGGRGGRRGGGGGAGGAGA